MTTTNKEKASIKKEESQASSSTFKKGESKSKEKDTLKEDSKSKVKSKTKEDPKPNIKETSKTKVVKEEPKIIKEASSSKSKIKTDKKLVKKTKTKATYKSYEERQYLKDNQIRQVYPLNKIVDYHDYLKFYKPDSEFYKKARNNRIHLEYTKELALDLINNQNRSRYKVSKELNVGYYTVKKWQNEHKDSKVGTKNEKPLNKVSIERNKRLESFFKKNKVKTQNKAIELASKELPDITPYHVRLYIKKNQVLTSQQDNLSSRNSSDNIEKRYTWARAWAKSGFHIRDNCIAVGDAKFKVVANKDSQAYRKGLSTHSTVFAAFSKDGIINLQSCADYLKKSKFTKFKQINRVAKRTGYFLYHFLELTMDVLDSYPQFKGYHILVRSQNINNPSRIEELIHSRGYVCVFLPKLYCSLNPIDLLWYKYKRSLGKKSIKEVDLDPTLLEITKNLSVKDLNKIVKPSLKRYNACLLKQPV